MKRFALIVTLILLAFSGRARGEASWYGYQILLSDGATTGAMFGLSPGFAINYLIGPPIIHGVHGNTGRIFGSIGLRIVAAVADEHLFVVAHERRAGTPVPETAQRAIGDGT